MTQTASPDARIIPLRTVRTRRIAFEYPSTDLPRHYMNGDLVMSHVVSVLSALFPNGEDFFVQSVRNYRDQIDDPQLKTQVGGFIGQEATHGREHRAFNDRLDQLGYPTRRIDRAVGLLFKGLGGKYLSKRVQLAVTAALEHYTATLAEVLLSSPEAREMVSVDEVRSLLLWHALEESEHKAVAFDVYQEVVGSHAVRVRTMNVVTIAFLTSVVFDTFLSLLGDASTRDLKRLGKSLGDLRFSPFTHVDVWRHLRDYNRQDFHPDDRDTRQLVEEWRTKLFGAEGQLAEKVKSRGPGGEDQLAR
ncbi:MAG TPA: metal-dependent hydrolase [Acidimicrobiales bacterium]|nr:metal-dependent hydrolase [Acidimicrobiales bacterium]